MPWPITHHELQHLATPVYMLPSVHTAMWLIMAPVLAAWLSLLVPVTPPAPTLCMLPVCAVHPVKKHEGARRSPPRNFLEWDAGRMALQPAWVQQSFPFVLTANQAVTAQLSSHIRVMVGAGSNPHAAAAALTAVRREHHATQHLQHESCASWLRDTVRQGHRDVRGEVKVRCCFASSGHTCLYCQACRYEQRHAGRMQITASVATTRAQVTTCNMQTTFPEFDSLDLTPGYTGVLLEAETEAIHQDTLDTMASMSCHDVFKVIGGVAAGVDSSSAVRCSETQFFRCMQVDGGFKNKNKVAAVDGDKAFGQTITAMNEEGRVRPGGMRAALGFMFCCVCRPSPAP